jgi:hypothetical protein
MNPLTQSKNTTIPPVLIALTLACFGLSPQARAVCRQGCDFIHANAFLGDDALGSNTSGSGNTAIGFEVLQSNTTGFFNTANGSSALSSNTTGFNNTANGWYALQMTTGSNNIAVGAEAGINLTSGNNNIDIGNPGIAGESRTIRVGTRQTHRATFIAGISGATVPAGVAVIVDGSGHLGTVVSSARFKDDIKPMEKASEAILALKPVTFRYKQELDPDGIPQFGLVAEEVEKVNPDLVARDEQEKPYSVRYEAVNAMLLNEFLKEHRKVEEQDRKIEELEATVAWQQRGFASAIAQQAKEIKALTSKIQKVSAELEARKSSPQIVLNNQ